MKTIEQTTMIWIKGFVLVLFVAFSQSKVHRLSIKDINSLVKRGLITSDSESYSHLQALLQSPSLSNAKTKTRNVSQNIPESRNTSRESSRNAFPNKSHEIAQLLSRISRLKVLGKINRPKFPANFADITTSAAPPTSTEVQSIQVVPEIQKQMKLNPAELLKTAQKINLLRVRESFLGRRIIKVKTPNLSTPVVEKTPEIEPTRTYSNEPKATKARTLSGHGQIPKQEKVPVIATTEPPKIETSTQMTRNMDSDVEDAPEPILLESLFYSSSEASKNPTFYDMPHEDRESMIKMSAMSNQRSHENTAESSVLRDHPKDKFSIRVSRKYNLSTPPSSEDQSDSTMKNIEVTPEPVEDTRFESEDDGLKASEPEIKDYELESDQDEFKLYYNYMSSYRHDDESHDHDHEKHTIEDPMYKDYDYSDEDLEEVDSEEAKDLDNTDDEPEPEPIDDDPAPRPYVNDFQIDIAKVEATTRANLRGQATTRPYELTDYLDVGSFQQGEVQSNDVHVDDLQVSSKTETTHRPIKHHSYSKSHGSKSQDTFFTTTDKPMMTTEPDPAEEELRSQQPNNIIVDLVPLQSQRELHNLKVKIVDDSREEKEEETNKIDVDIYDPKQNEIPRNDDQDEEVVVLEETGYGHEAIEQSSQNLVNLRHLVSHAMQHFRLGPLQHEGITDGHIRIIDKKTALQATEGMKKVSLRSTKKLRIFINGTFRDVSIDEWNNKLASNFDGDDQLFSDSYASGYTTLLWSRI